MSFITKRERVFNEYVAPVDLPPRNEGKLKAYSSCTDARAWSHFVSDKTEHLVEIIKRNNEICRGKYVPINVIIEMMLAAKNAEIARLKRKIAQLEQMLAAYDQLDLSCEQKCEISTAHAMIKAATKSLEALPPLELDISGFTEGGIDSEAFQTGKSGGDDASIRQKGVEWVPSTGRSDKDMESKGFGPFGFDPLGYEGLGGIEPKSSKISRASKINQSDFTDRCACDVSTSAHDNKLEELEETLISKDAKLNAMQNTLAVMENDVCEPYCIYAHVFTALEKIYGTLRQNEKYRLFLDLMSTGKDTRSLDIKGKILFKLKILEKFSIALISPCSERFKYDESCECYAAQVETSFTSTQPVHQVSKPSDVMRTHLIADVMENEDMKEIITKESPNQQNKYDVQAYDILATDNYSIDTENLTRIKSLQADYEDLMNAYEDVKFERDTLKVRWQKYENLEKELEDCRNKLREYNMLFNEREYYRNRSEDLDSLKEQYMILADESSSLETQLKAETEINHIKAGTIDELRNDNITLEKKLNDLTIAYEKERNAVLCKLKEADCKIMCQEQQIKSLSSQIDRIIDQDQDNHDKVFKSAKIIDEIEALRDQIKILNGALYAIEDEKQQLQYQFEDKLKLINELKMEIEEWKSTCEKTLQRNDYLEKYTESIRDEVRRLVEENRELSDEVEEKTTAVANLINVINNKSQEVNKLIHDIEVKRDENEKLKKQLQDAKETYGSSVRELEDEKRGVLESLQLARHESEELLEKVKDYDEILHKKEDIVKSLATETENCNELKNMLVNAIEDNKNLQQNLRSQENNNLILIQEIQRLREINNFAVENINSLQNDKDQYKTSYESAKKEIEIQEDKLKEFIDLRGQLQILTLSHEKLLNEKNKLDNDLQGKAKDLAKAMHSVELTRKESEDLLEKVQQSENLKEDMIRLSKDYRNLVNENQALQIDLTDKNKELDNLLETFDALKAENYDLLEKAKKADEFEHKLNQLNKDYDNLKNEKTILQNNFDMKTQEINKLFETLEEKNDENKDLANQIKALDKHHTESVANLQDVNLTTQLTLNSLQRESEELLNKLKNYETLLNKYEDLKIAHKQIKEKNNKLQSDLDNHIKDLKITEEERDDLKKQANEILSHNENLQKALIDARQELIQYTTQGPFDDVVREIEDIKKEKVANGNKIKELLDKLEEQDNVISNLCEDLLARDDKIAVLQNHINSLEEEVRQLHECLAEVVNTGEQIKDNSFKKIDQTLNKMEAHHSKATHNMKMELAKLHNINAKLEEQLSVHKIKSDESFKDKHKYISQIIHLENEREIIATDIKQLEVNCTGNSNISPTSCGVEEIIKSLDKIKKYIDARNSKSNSLEQTLQKVQNSSQLLLSKADEAKKLVEKEKQKIINEKEEAIADRLNIERQLLELKVQLEEQTANDKNIIKDLEAEILNQKLISDKLNEQTRNYIAKLEDEMRSLQDLYQNSLAKIAQLQDKLKRQSEENDKTMNILDKIKTELKKKSEEVYDLQKDLNKLQNKSMKNINIQVESLSKKKNTKSQTDKSSFDEELGLNEIKKEEYMQDENIMKSNKSSKTPDHKQISQILNEVQILTANIEPPLEFVKSYVNYKKTRLAPGKLEQYSISTITGDSLSANPNLMDIYKRPSDMHTVSSKAMKTDDEIASTSAVHDPQTSSKNSHFGPVLVSDVKDLNTSYQDQFKEPQPGTSSDKDLFLVYKDSESSHADNTSVKGKGINNILQPILVEAVTMQQDRESNIAKPYRPAQLKIHEEDDMAETYHIRDRIKQSLGVKIPRTLNDDTSYETVTDASRSQVRSDESKVQLKPETLKSDESQRLSRVDGEFVLFKGKTDQYKSKIRDSGQQGKNFGLEYILDSVKQEIIYPEKLADMNNKLRKSLSDDLYQRMKGSSECQTPLLLVSSDGKTNSAQSNSKWSDSSRSKPVAEQSVMVNIDPTDYYENKIRSLSQQIENTENEYKKKLSAIKAQYDSNIKSIMNEHNQGVRSIQNLHEDTLQDVIKIHENEVENLRTMSIEAMRKADKLQRENRLLKSKIQDCTCSCVGLDGEPAKYSTLEVRKRRSRCRDDTRMLTKTNVEAFNVKPKLRIHGPCTCSLDVNVSDTIRNIFEQVDVEQRKLAEHAYLKYIANKIMTANVESLDVNELSFLHLKVCRMWKNKISKEEALQKRIDSLECELLNKQRCTQQHFAELDRRVAEEHRRLQEAREAVCRCPPDMTDSLASTDTNRLATDMELPLNPPNTAVLHSVHTACSCNSLEVRERRSAGDLLGSGSSSSPLKLKSHKGKPESRATLAKLDIEERRMKKMYDEPPTRLRRSHERPSRTKK